MLPTKGRNPARHFSCICIVGGGGAMGAPSFGRIRRISPVTDMFPRVPHCNTKGRIVILSGSKRETISGDS